MKKPLYDSELDWEEVIDPESVSVYGLEFSIKCCKYPKAVDVSKCNEVVTKTVEALAKTKAGTAHNNFIKGIVVEFDLTMTPKMSVELERYHFIDFISLT